MNVRLLSSWRAVTTALESFFNGSGKRAGGFSGLRVAYVRQRDDRPKGNRGGLNMGRRGSPTKKTRRNAQLISGAPSSEGGFGHGYSFLTSSVERSNALANQYNSTYN